MNIRRTIIRFIFFILGVEVFAGSGGPLSREQAAYDVKYYNLNISINTTARSIDGILLCSAEIKDTISRLVLDIDTRFSVTSALFKKGTGSFSAASYSLSSGKLYISFPEPVVIGDLVTVKVFYNGIPRVASNPPWSSGFVWDTTPSNKPFLGVTCEYDGGDYWWPCKDHPSDEPDSMHLSFTVPNPLQCISNGRFLGSVDNGNNTSTYSWFVSTPINNYNVTFYAAEYLLIQNNYLSTSGDSIPFRFWVLPERYNTAVNFMGVFLNEFNFLESACGPFPFGMDKHGFADAPYWGMEHQTIVAYGHNFSVNSWGYDYIHYHEMAHEWWGNLITAKDWSDVWIHEGIATYTEALYVEHLSGISGYLQKINSIRPSDNHVYALAPRDSLTAEQAFNNLDPYYRGALVMHTLRYHLGDVKFFNLLKRWAYPDSTDYNNINGRLCRIVSTDDMKNLAEEVTGVELDPFFETFFRQALYPKLRIERAPGSAVFIWQTQSGIPLDVDVLVLVNGAPMTVVINNGIGSAPIPSSATLVVDPQKWILMSSPIIISVPVELASFTAAVSGNFVNLAWSTKTETNNRIFEIERRYKDEEWNIVGFVQGAGTTTEPKEYSFQDHLSVNGKYSYRLKQIDNDGSFEYSEIINIDFKSAPDFALVQNYPNPFNPATVLGYSIPEKSQVIITIYDILGNEIKTIVNEEKSAGTYEITWDASAMPGGVYFYRIKAGNFMDTKKMILLR